MCMYGYNNPVKYVDPTGHAADAGGADYTNVHDLLYLIARIAQGDMAAKDRMEAILGSCWGSGSFD